MEFLMRQRSISVLVVITFLSSPAIAESVLLFPYFVSNGENGVYLAWSNDGRNFHSVNSGKPIFKPPQWDNEQHLTRDPSIVFHKGFFHMVWTSNWDGRWFGYASSKDLKVWSKPRLIQPFREGSEQPKNVWAPELFHDSIADDFKVVWSSTLMSELEDDDGSEDTHGNDHRLYYLSTKNFEDFSEPKLLFHDENYSVIDAHVVFDDRGTSSAKDDRWIMCLKKELPGERGGKNIRLAFSQPKITPTSFRDTTKAIVGVGTPIQGTQMAEGPSLVKWNGQWLLYWDSYTASHYSLASSSDLQQWTAESNLLKLPADHPRHGTVFSASLDKIAWPLNSQKKVAR